AGRRQVTRVALGRTRLHPGAQAGDVGIRKPPLADEVTVPRHGRPGGHLPELDGAQELLAPAVGVVEARQGKWRDLTVTVAGLAVRGEERCDVAGVGGDAL